MPAVLEFQSVSKSFGKQIILKNISLSVEAGEFLTLLGPSGSGKTTLLRLAGGFEFADAGKIFLNGRDISRLPPYERSINTVFQSYALFPHLDVYRNVAFGLRNIGIRPDEQRKRILEALEMVQLQGFEKRLPDELSGGQQQRVALARALVMHPAVVLLDEPFGALDQKLRKLMQSELKVLQRKLELTFVFVTHDQEEALSLSDRIALLHQGQIEQLGRPDEIYETPRTRFAAEFMGIENIVELSNANPNGSTIHCGTAAGQVFLAKARESVWNGGKFLAIRSNEITISKSAPVDGSTNIVRGTVCQQSYRGDVVLWKIQSESGQGWLVSQPASRGQNGSEQLSVGDAVFCCWEIQRGLLVS